MSTLTSRGPHRVLRGNLAIAGQPGVVYTPESGKNLPAVAFAHGWLTGVGNYRTLLEHLASWGFVVAAPNTERGPIPSHVGLAADLLTTLDISTGVRLGDGTISVRPDRLALVGHGMGASVAVLAAAQRDVAAIAALFPAPSAPSAESVAGKLTSPALVLAGASDISSAGSNAIPLAAAWGGPVLLRALAGATHNGIVEGRSTLATLGTGKHETKTTRTTRALLTAFLLSTLTGDKTYAPFTDPETSIGHTAVIDPHAELEEKKPASGLVQAAKLIQTLRK